jgi:signal transduction histidine kinase
VTEALQLLQYVVAAAFVGLALVTCVDWLGKRDAARGYLSLAIGLLAMVTVLGRLQAIGVRGPAVTDLSILAFIGSGYALLLFRGCFIPLSGRTHLLVVAGLGLVAVLPLIVGVPVQPGPSPTPLQTAALLALVLGWSACVAEPIIRFWLASLGRPAVQKMRLRSLSIAYGGLVGILLVSGGASSAVQSPAGQLVIQLIALSIVPLLYVSFSPPVWLRREWRSHEEEAYRLAIQDLLLFSPSRKVLAERATDWAMRLVGADAAMIADHDGSAIAASGMREAQVERLLSQMGGMQANEIVRLPGAPNLSAIIVGLPLDSGPGALVVVSGPFTPVFATDELQRLQQYATAITVGLDRTVMTERIAALERTKTQFLNLASHELRGPITVIRGYLSMLERGNLGQLSKQARAVLPALAAKAEEMNLLVEQMLEAARLEEGRLELDPQPADLRELARQAVDLMSPLAAHGHRLVLDSPAEAVPVVVDRSRIGTILNNLLDNAMKYSPAGGEVHCRVSRDMEVGKVEVTDKGVGIASSDLPHLFTRFGRVVTSETSHIPGTGLGLYLSRELARLHGGDITVQSKPGSGSTFVLAVPLRSA